MTEVARRYGLGAFAHRNFRLFFIGQGISLVGTWMQNVGEGWLILTLTNSPFYVGLTAALSLRQASISASSCARPFRVSS